MEELSSRLFSACTRMHDAVTGFYEEVHPDGTPIKDEETLLALTTDLKYSIRLELDYVKELIKEENEQVG